MINLQTTIEGMELTLTTLGEISTLIQQLDERLAQLSPELPRLSSANTSSSPSAFRDMLAAYEQVFGAFEEAARAAKVLGIDCDLPNIRVAVAPQRNPETVVTPSPVNTPPAVIENVSTEEVVKPEPAPLEQAAIEAVQLVVEQSHAEPATAEEIEEPSLEVVEGFTINRPIHVAAKGQHIRSDNDLTKPLKPIEMPAADFEVGPVICNGPSIIYAHGPELRKYWPGATTVKGKLEGPIPNDSWRLVVVDSHVFCAGDNAVSILKVDDLQNAGSIPGKFVAQSRTANSWVGVRDDSGTLSVMFKDKKGKAFMGGEKLGDFPSEKLFLETAGDVAFVALGCGDLFRVDGGSADHIANAGNYVNIAGLIVDSLGVVVTNQSADGVWLTMLDHSGRGIRRSASFAKSISHQPLLIDEKLFLFDDKTSEVVTVCLNTLQELQRSYVDGVTSIGQMIAINDDDGGTIAMVATNIDERPVAVHLHSISTGLTSKLCQISAVKSHVGYADGHIVVASTSSMQNLIQVFNVYSSAGVKAMAA